MIMCLVGMGFELEDAQQAVSAGKLSVEAAIEWHVNKFFVEYAVSSLL